MMSIVEHGRQLITSVREWIVGPPLVEDEPPKSEPVKRLIAASRSLAASLHAFDELGLISEDHSLMFIERLGIHLANKLWIEGSREPNFLDRLARTPFDEIRDYIKSNLPIPTDESLEETGFLRALDHAAKDTVTLLDKRGIKVKLESVLYRFVSQQQVPEQDVRSVLSYFTVTDGLVQELRAMYKEGNHRANIECFKPEATSPFAQPLTPHS